MDRSHFYLDERDYRQLVNGSLILICAERCELWTQQIRGELFFVMSGPSGRHVLCGASTDLNRLNAHWKGFAGHPANARKH